MKRDPDSIKSDLGLRIRIAKRREEGYLTVDLADLEALLTPPAPPEPLELFLVASGSGYWLVMDKKALWHHYNDNKVQINELVHVVTNTLDDLGVPWVRKENIEHLGRRLDSIEDRTGTSATEILEFMLARGQF